MPGQKPGTISSFVQPPDLMPTVMDALGFSNEEITSDWAAFKNPALSARFTGKSLIPLIKGEVDSLRDFAVTAYHGKHWSIRTEEWAFLKNLKGDKEKFLYSRKDDLAEMNNCIEVYPEIAQELESKLDSFAEETHRKAAKTAESKKD